MTVTSKLKPDDRPTAEQLKRIEQAAKMSIIPDDMCPVYTPEQLAYLYAQSKQRNVKQTVGIRLN